MFFAFGSKEATIKRTFVVSIPGCFFVDFCLCCLSPVVLFVVGCLLLIVVCLIFDCCLDSRSNNQQSTVGITVGSPEAVDPLSLSKTSGVSRVLRTSNEHVSAMTTKQIAIETRRTNT